jgi:hypothetical protein
VAGGYQHARACARARAHTRLGPASLAHLPGRCAAGGCGTRLRCCCCCCCRLCLCLCMWSHRCRRRRHGRPRRRRCLLLGGSGWRRGGGGGAGSDRGPLGGPGQRRRGGAGAGGGAAAAAAAACYAAAAGALDDQVQAVWGPRLQGLRHEGRTAREDGSGRCEAVAVRGERELRARGGTRRHRRYRHARARAHLLQEVAEPEARVLQDFPGVYELRARRRLDPPLRR